MDLLKAYKKAKPSKAIHVFGFSGKKTVNAYDHSYLKSPYFKAKGKKEYRSNRRRYKNYYRDPLKDF
jgi:hypothetical protein